MSHNANQKGWKTNGNPHAGLFDKKEYSRLDFTPKHIKNNLINYDSKRKNTSNATS